MISDALYRIFASGCVAAQSNNSSVLFRVFSVALVCCIAIVLRPTRNVESTLREYNSMLPNTPWILLIFSLETGGDSSGSIWSWECLPYFFGAMTYGECCGCGGASCFYF